MRPRQLLTGLGLGLFVFAAAGAAEWKPAVGPLATRWAKDVSPDSALPDYPRPQLVRKDWLNLNGLWQYAVRSKDDSQPKDFEGQILVPFAIESALSGVMRRVDETNRLWYRRTFELPQSWKGQRIRLHFGAVDWETTAWVNGKQVASHRGGYDPFSSDITEALAESGTQELVVSAWDPTDTGTQPRGKQVKKPGGIMYTPTTGIWQTVWLEPVPHTSIEDLHIVPDVDGGRVLVTAKVPVTKIARSIRLTAMADKKVVATATGDINAAIPLKLDAPRLWSPDDPFLYDLRVEMLEMGQPADQVESYFGMRKVSLGKTEAGITRIFLNGKPLFMFGPLDQGFWPDGLYTAPTDAALKYDVEVTRQLGFNMARKHVKVEPARWYYWCDKLGLLVWQDMPSGDRSIGPNDPDIKRSPESAQQYEAELKAMIDTHRNHPSIVMWVPFNEGWGQFDTRRITEWTKQYDPTRLVDCASGWTDRDVGDVHDVHVYPGPGSPAPESNRAAVLGEYGGLGLPMEGHTWQAKDNWGYRSFTDRPSLTAAYLELNDNLHVLIGDPGLSAAVYTQTTDVEIEVNGLLTYDRAVIKPDAAAITAANLRMHQPPPTVKTIIPTAAKTPAEWKYTLSAPGDGWEKPGFDDSSWKRGPSGFGTRGTPGATIGTEWSTSDIWLRREVELPPPAARNPRLLIHHDEGAEVYIDGAPAAKLSGYTTAYTRVPLSDAARGALRPGKHVIAIHCRQTEGGQYIDLGLVEVVPAGEQRAEVGTPAVNKTRSK